MKKTICSVFWVGEKGDASNAGISNVCSAWQDDWLSIHNKNDENPYYVALNVSDIDEEGSVKWPKDSDPKVWKDILKEALALTHKAGKPQSYLKNSWVRVKNTANGKVGYGQWEDVGPFEVDNEKSGCDVGFVFGNNPKPTNRLGLKAGIDLSPALAKHLGINGSGEVEFEWVGHVGPLEVGPWNLKVTKSNCVWA